MSTSFKRKWMNDYEFFQKKRWEGKPLKFKFKYLIANYPECAFAVLATCFIAPAFALYRYFNYEGSRRHGLTKFKSFYMVVRDDDPRLEAIEKQKQIGREYFPN